MKKTTPGKSFLVMGLVLGAASYAFSADAEVKLNSADGSTGFIVQDMNAVTVFSADSAGNIVINGTATVAGSQFSVGGSTFVVAGGKVGIGTTDPKAMLDVNGAVRVGNFTTAARPVAVPANTGAFIFDTDIGKPYVSNGTVWKPLDSDELKLNSSNGLTKFIIQDNAAVTVFSADSDGNTIINGTATVAGSQFSVGGSTFVVAGGKVGIGTAAPAATLDVNGGLRVGNFTNAARPEAISANTGAFIFNTDSGKAYVSNGTVWKPFDSDFDGDGITDAIDVNDNNAADATAVAADTLLGKTFYALGAAKTGTMPTLTLSAANETVAAGYYTGTTLSAVDGNLTAENIKAGVTIFGKPGTFTTGATAVEADTLSGKTFYVGGAVKTGTIPTRTLSAENETIAAGYYAATTLSAVDTDLTVGNIKTGITIFGKLGTFTTGATAVEADTLLGKTFYAEGVVKTGTMPTRTLSAANETVAAGYYTGTTLSAVDTDLTAWNIKNGVTIFGKAGVYIGNYLPDTGYTTVLVAGDDASYPSSAQPSYTDNGDGTITDNRTGLMWAKDGNGAGCNTGNMGKWETAGFYCQNLILPAGLYEDWRLPNVRELMSIVNYGAYSPSINAGFFPNTKTSDYWSSTTYATSITSAWVVVFDIGITVSSSKTNNGYVRCVRGGS